MEREAKGKTYKLNGHTLPGINQRSDAKATNVAAEGLAGSSVFQQVPGVQPPIPPPVGGVGAMGGMGAGMGMGMGMTPTPPIMSKPSVAKDKAYTKMHLPENKNHNAKAATEQHYGYPHGPKPSVAKRYKKTGSTMGSYPSMRKIK